MSAFFEGWALPPEHSPPADPVEEGGVLRPHPAAAWIMALAGTLRRAGETRLRDLTAGGRAELLGRAGERFLDPSDPLRREAEAWLPETSGLSSAMARAVIDGMARDWTEGRLRALLDAELPAGALDRFVPDARPPGADAPGGSRAVRAYPPALSFHVGAGTVPGVTAISMMRALLVGSAVLVKPGRGDVVLPVLLARALARDAPAVGAATAVLGWSGGEAAREAEDAALRSSDLVVVYGGDETVRALRDRTPATTRFVAYHHRVGAMLVGREALTRDRLGEVGAAAAWAVAAFDQRGCVSPHAMLVEEGGEVSPHDVAAAVATSLDRLHGTLPPGPLGAGEASAIHQLRRTIELRAAAGEAVALHAGPDVSWTVALENGGTIEPSCPGRTIRVYPIADARDAAGLLAPWGAHLQTLGVAGLGERLEGIADALGRLGVVRICALAAVPFPPPWWHHDGRGPLTDLVRWVDLER